MNSNAATQRIYNWNFERSLQFSLMQTLTHVGNGLLRGHRAALRWADGHGRSHADGVPAPSKGQQNLVNTL